MLVNRTHSIKWHNKNQKHFEGMGYVFTKRGDFFEVVSEHLAPNSKTIVTVKCDYCGDLHEKQFGNYNAAREKLAKDSCNECKYLKVRESNIKKYGQSVAALESTRKKMAETSLLRYGKEHYAQTDKHKQNMREHFLQKHGVEYYSQTQEYKIKCAATSLKRYGVSHYSKTKEFSEKIQKTNLERYGVPYYSQTDNFTTETADKWKNKTPEEIQSITNKRQAAHLKNCGFMHPMQNPEIKKKAMQTVYENGNMTASSQQLYICELVNGVLNYPVGLSHLDIAFPEDKIYVEYDGGGHNLGVKIGNTTQEEFDAKDRRRSFSLFDKGWKEIRLVTDTDKLPKDCEILKTFKKAKSFLMEQRNKSVIVNWDTRTVLISFKKEIPLDEFLSDDFKFNWEVS